MASRYQTISFLSDYGHADEFVGVCRSVIRSLAPEVVVVDITHEIPPHDVRAGALTLARTVQYLNPGVVLAVVDPGVGTARRPVAVEVGGGQSVLVGPDNGLLAPAVAMCEGATRAVELVNADYQLPTPGATFDGRDVFAPAAAHLCAGVALAELGEEIDPSSLLPGIIPVARPEGDRLVAEVLWVDRFGNAQLNLDPEEVEALGRSVRVRLGERTHVVSRATSYEEIGAGELGLVTDSYGLLSVATTRGSAAELLGIAAGDEVILEPPDDEGSPEGAAVRPVRSPRP